MRVVVVHNASFHRSSSDVKPPSSKGKTKAEAHTAVEDDDDDDDDEEMEDNGDDEEEEDDDDDEV